MKKKTQRNCPAPHTAAAAENEKKKKIENYNWDKFQLKHPQMDNLIELSTLTPLITQSQTGPKQPAE